MFDRGFVLLAVVLALGTLSLPLGAQTSPNIEKLAVLTAERVAKTHAQHVLTAALQGCLLNTQVCEELDAALHTALKKVVSNAELVSRQQAVSVLKMHGSLALDAYNDLALQAVTLKAGAEVLITEDLRWKPDAYELITQVFDAAHGKELREFKVSVSRSVPDSDDLPVIFKDAESGTSLVIPKRKESHPRYFASCEKCPDPAYTPEAGAKGLQGMVAMLVTVTEQGVADHIVVVKSFDDAIARQAVETVQSWKFKPVFGPDGKPFAVRMTIEVNYRLRP